MLRVVAMAMALVAPAVQTQPIRLPPASSAASPLGAAPQCGSAALVGAFTAAFTMGFTRRMRGLQAGARELPAAPSELTKLYWEDYGAHLLLAITLTSACAMLSASTSPCLAGLAGALAVPIVIFQHDVRHLHHAGTTFEEKLSDVLVLVTGTCYGILPWSGVHVKHHAFTGSYQGAVVAPALRNGVPGMGDLDDLAGPLRHGNPFEPARRSSTLRALAAFLCILLTVSLFQGHALGEGRSGGERGVV